MSPTVPRAVAPAIGQLEPAAYAIWQIGAIPGTGV